MQDAKILNPSIETSDLEALQWRAEAQLDAIHANALYETVLRDLSRALKARRDRFAADLNSQAVTILNGLQHEYPSARLQKVERAIEVLMKAAKILNPNLTDRDLDSLEFMTDTEIRTQKGFSSTKLDEFYKLVLMNLSRAFQTRRMLRQW